MNFIARPIVPSDVALPPAIFNDDEVADYHDGKQFADRNQAAIWARDVAALEAVAYVEIEDADGNIIERVCVE